MHLKWVAADNIDKVKIPCSSEIKHSMDPI